MPHRADANAASVPAWPPPTTITSKFKLNFTIDLYSNIIPERHRNARHFINYKGKT